MHSPAPRCDSLKVRPMALSERKRGLLAAEDWTPKGYIYCRTKTKKIITPISAVDKKRVYKTSKLQVATKKKSAGVTYNSLRRRPDEG